MSVVALVTFSVALTPLFARATYGAEVTADEPQYLTTAISLAEDLDLDISDELEDERYLPFHEIGLNQQTLDLNDDGQRLSPHDPLLPAILATPMHWFGWRAARVTLAAIAGLTAAVTLWTAVRRLGVATGPAAIVSGVLFAAPPLVSYGNQIYPEIVAALCVIGAVAALAGSRSWPSIAVATIAIVGLPWLAVKYAPVAVVLSIWLLAPLVRSSRTRAFGIAALLLAAGLAYLVFHRQVYGGWTVYAAGDHFVDGEFEVVGTAVDYVGRTRRLTGLILDQGFGIAAWTPAYVLAPAAVASLLFRRVDRAGWLVAVVLAGWATATWVALTMHGWWWPGRQVVVILPVVVLAIAAWADRSRVARWSTVVGGLFGAIAWIWLAVEASTGRLTLIVDFGRTANPLYQAWASVLPNHMDMRGRDVVLTAVWSIALLSPVGYWLFDVRRRQSQPKPMASGGPEGQSTSVPVDATA